MVKFQAVTWTPRPLVHLLASWHLSLVHFRPVRRRGRQADLEHGAVVVSHADRPAVQLHDGLDDGEPQATAAGGLSRQVGLVEPVEDQWKVFGWNAGPVVADSEDHFVAVTPRGQMDLAPIWCVAKGVRRQILKRLLQSIGVSDD